MITRYRSNGDLFLCTRIQRTAMDGDKIDVDLIIYFRVTSYSPGSPGCMYQRNGDPGWPPEPAEYEFEIDRIEFDGCYPVHNVPPDDAPWPITDEEDATLRQWFDAHYDQAYQAAVDAQVDERADRADYEYDRRRDEEMERRAEMRRAAE